MTASAGVGDRLGRLGEPADRRGHLRGSTGRLPLVIFPTGEVLVNPSNEERASVAIQLLHTLFARR